MRKKGEQRLFNFSSWVEKKHRKRGSGGLKALKAIANLRSPQKHFLYVQILLPLFNENKYKYKRANVTIKGGLRKAFL